MDLEYKRWCKKYINVPECKSCLIQFIRRKTKTLELKNTGISIILIKVLVLRSPMMRLHKFSAKNRVTRRATDAGNETELNLIKEFTP